MIIGRENTKKELAAQQYLIEKIQPCLSEMTDELLKTKPADPIPTMVTVFNRMSAEAAMKLKTAKLLQNMQLNSEQMAEYEALVKERDQLKLELS